MLAARDEQNSRLGIFRESPSYRAAASSHSDVERAARKNTRKYLLHSYRYIELPYIEIQAEYLRIRTGGAAGGGGLGISRIPGFLNSWMFSVGGDGPSDGLDVIAGTFFSTIGTSKTRLHVLCLWHSRPELLMVTSGE